MIADDLHLIFLPAQHRFLDQHFGCGGGIEAFFHDVEEFLAVVGDAAARAAQCEGRADDAGQTHFQHGLEGFDHGAVAVFAQPLGLGCGPALLESLEVATAGLQPRHLGGIEILVGVLCIGGVRQHRFWRVEADLLHRLAEQFTVFRLVDGVRLGADELHAVFLEHAHLVEGECGVQRRLAAHGGKQRVRPLLLDDSGDDFRGDRLDVGGIRQVRVRHDGGRIGVDQDDAVTLGLQRLAGLGAGIVELAGLADDDRSSPDDEDGFDVSALWHVRETRILGFLHTRRMDSKPNRPLTVPSLPEGE